MENDQETPLLEVLQKALIVWLKALFYFVVLPYKIWKSAAYRLAEMSGKSLVGDDEEFPVYTYNKVAIDATIFMWPVFALLNAIIISAQSYSDGFFIFLIVLVVFYIIIPVISFVKEVITMSLSVVSNLREIAKNTKK